MALLQWNQLAAMNRHYVHYSLRRFFFPHSRSLAFVKFAYGPVRRTCCWMMKAVRTPQLCWPGGGVRAFHPRAGPRVHTVSVFYQQLERNGARKGIGLLYASILLTQELGARVMLVNCGGGAKDMSEVQAQQHAVQMLKRLGAWRHSTA